MGLTVTFSHIYIFYTLFSRLFGAFFCESVFLDDQCRNRGGKKRQAEIRIVGRKEKVRRP